MSEGVVGFGTALGQNNISHQLRTVYSMIQGCEGVWRI